MLRLAANLLANIAKRVYMMSFSKVVYRSAFRNAATENGFENTSAAYRTASRRQSRAFSDTQVCEDTRPGLTSHSGSVAPRPGASIQSERQSGCE